jgi:6-hydroxytryprostatin B O-methyltransferase
MAMTNNLFHEPKPDCIAHSSTSALLVTNLDYNDWATSLSGALFDVGLKLPSAMEKWPESEEKNETAYQLAFDTPLPFFGHMSQQPQKMKQFAGFMRSLTTLESNDIRHLVEGFDWASLGKATVVDVSQLPGSALLDMRQASTATDVACKQVGGSTGHACINLAKAYPDLTFVVQDLPRNAEQGKAAIASQSEDIAARISFQAHDFFQPQPVKGAQVYLLRTILHDWPAKEAQTILANLFTAMESESRILIMDIILPAAGSIEPLQEGTLRNRDLLMMGLFNSKQRYLEDWTALVDHTDAKLAIKNVVRPFNSAMSVIEVGHREQNANVVH